MNDKERTLQLLGSEAKRLSVNEVVKHFGTSGKNGLSTDQVERLLTEVGPNELQEEESDSLLKKFLEQFNDPMIIMLFVSAVVSVVLGQLSDALSIFLAIVIVCTVAFIQEYRSDKAIEELQELVTHSCTVIRDGAKKVVNTKELVPGDLVTFQTGDRVPADIRITEIFQPIAINESVFTGENRPRKKLISTDNSPMKNLSQNRFLRRRKNEEEEEEEEEEKFNFSDDFSKEAEIYGDENKDETYSFPRVESWGEINEKDTEQRWRVYSNVVQCLNIAFQGTILASGEGNGIVIATGNNTELGRISLLLQSIKEVKTPLEKTMGKLAQTISYISFAIIGVIFIIGVLSGKGWMEMFNMGISLAVAAIPEGLPVVVTVTLGMGVLRMAKKNTIVRKLQSVETLGAVNVVCSDKTGTLTENQMTVTDLFIPSEPQKIVHITGAGYNPTGEFYFCDVNNWKETYDVKRSPSMDQQFLPKSAVKIARNRNLERICLAGNVCNSSNIEEEGGLVGLPTEGALIVLSQKFGLPDCREKIWNKIDEKCVPFSSQRKWMGVFANKVGNLPKISDFSSDGDNTDDGLNETFFDKEEKFFVKGALEKVLEFCTFYQGKDKPIRFRGSGSSSMMNDNEGPSLTKDDILGLAGDLIRKKNLRILGVAEGNSSDPQDMLFLGFVGMTDPPRIGVHDSIKKLKSSGIRVIMITGDSRETALSIAQSLDIIDEGDKEEDICFTSSDLQNPISFYEKVDKAKVFYRVEPTHKMTIVHALQKKGYIVGMTGDGINDAPAVKKADIGISMGRTGTDVCREASDMVLTDDNFSTIMVAIEEGKSIFNNIKHFLRFQLTTSVTAMGLIVFSTIFDYPLPLNPMQILYVNLIMDGAPAQSLGLEPVDPDVMKKPPRRMEDNIISKQMVISILINSSVMMIGSLWVFLKEFFFDYVVDARDTTMVFTTFVCFQIFNAFNCRSADKSVFEIGFFKNKPLLFATSGSLIGLIMLLYVPFLRSIFDTVPLGIMDWCLITVVSSSVLFVEEFIKYVKKKRRKD